MIHTGISPIPRGWRSQAQRDLDNARLAAEEEAQRAAERERAAAPAPEEAADDPPRDGEGAAAPAADGGGYQPEAAPAESPHHHPADGPAVPAERLRLPRSGEDQEDEDEDEDEDRDEDDECDPVLTRWLTRNWDLVNAMAQAGEAPLRPPPPQVPANGAPPPPPPPVPRVRRGDRWDKPKMAEFLRQLAATHSVSAAARAVGLSRESAYRLRNRLKGQPFDIAWEAAFRQGYDNLAHAALDLALNGEEVPHYHGGKLVGTHRKRSAQLILGVLKMRNRMGAPMLGRYGAAAEFWSEEWDRMLQRIETGPVTWEEERAALAKDAPHALQLPDASAKAERIIERNRPDDPAKRR
jgi:hypothetical protein